MTGLDETRLAEAITAFDDLITHEDTLRLRRAVAGWEASAPKREAPRSGMTKAQLDGLLAVLDHGGDRGPSIELQPIKDRLRKLAAAIRAETRDVERIVEDDSNKGEQT